MLIFILFSMSFGSINAVIYDCVSGKPVTKKQLNIYREKNNTEYCVIDVKPCDPDEWRRVDGSCNNLKYPSRGMVRTPTTRLLPPEFSPNYEPRQSKNCKSLPLARRLRTELLESGKATDLEITQLVSFYLLFVINDVNSFQDIATYLLNITNCCEPEGKNNYMCTPNEIPVDDPVHRYSGLTCQNLTRPLSFQYFGCLDFGTPFVRIVFATSLLDLSHVYGNSMDVINQLRTFENGLLKIEIDNGKVFPPKNPNTDPRANRCAGNILPKESRCHWHQPSGVIGSNLITILFYRHHNYIAERLAEMNRCWNDDRLYNTAADINIAIYINIYYYYLLPIILGRRNMIRADVISSTGDFRDLYDENIQPQVYDEFTYIHRWAHTIQETDFKRYDTDGCYQRTDPMLNLTSRSGMLPYDDNLVQYFQGTFRQPGAKFDHIIDYDMAERLFGPTQFAFDAGTVDLARGRYFGFAPYVKYREFCTGKTYDSFDSLRDVMSKERIYRLKENYENAEDIDLMAGMWAENPIPGGRVPHTMYCLMVKQLKLFPKLDRHWYEGPNRPHAFNLEQLQAIRRSTLSGLYCATADGVTKIQPNAFLTISPDNPLTDCNSPDIGVIDLSPWKDPECWGDYGCQK